VVCAEPFPDVAEALSVAAELRAVGLPDAAVAVEREAGRLMAEVAA
jgi:hypothetical protein